MRNLRIMAFASSLAVVAAVSAQGSVEARDLATLGHDEITALQQRLTDTACYKGTVDGIPSPALDAAIKACPASSAER